MNRADHAIRTFGHSDLLIYVSSSAVDAPPDFTILIAFEISRAATDLQLGIILRATDLQLRIILRTWARSGLRRC